MALTTRITTNVACEYVSTTLDHGSVAHYPQLPKNIDMASGITTGLADVMWSDKITITASATNTLDLAGSLTGVFGTATFAKLKYIKVIADSGNTNNVNVVRPSSNGVPIFLAAGDGIPVLPGGFFEWCGPAAGVTVTAATGDLLDLVNSAGGSSVLCDVMIIGTSA